MLSFNNWIERKQETGKRKRSFWLLPSLSRSNERDNQEANHVQSKDIPSLLSTSSRRRQQGRIKRLRHTLTARPIEGQNLTGANSQSKDTTCCCLCPIEGHDLAPAKAQSKDVTLLLPAPIKGGQQNSIWSVLLPGSKDTQFFLFFSFPSYFLCLLICL